MLHQFLYMMKLAIAKMFFVLSLRVERATDAAASTVTSETVVAGVPRRTRVLFAYYVPAAALTADNTNYATITVSARDAAGGNKTTIASRTTQITGSGNWTAWVPVPLTVTAVTSHVAAGGTITYEVAKAGTGVQLPAGSVFLVVSDVAAS